MPVHECSDKLVRSDSNAELLQSESDNSDDQADILLECHFRVINRHGQKLRTLWNIIGFAMFSKLVQNEFGTPHLIFFKFLFY